MPAENSKIAAERAERTGPIVFINKTGRRVTVGAAARTVQCPECNVAVVAAKYSVSVLCGVCGSVVKVSKL